jgi:hypothetical protein
MRPAADVERVFELLAEGWTHSAVARSVGISRATVRDWDRSGREAVLARRGRALPAVACEGTCAGRAGLDEAAYAYLLGQYLGDGCLSRNGPSYRIRIACADAYPGIMRECVAAIAAVSGRPARFAAKQGCTEVHALWPHWQCVVPHGPGPKHTRPIVLEPWQRRLALDRHAGAFVRGLVHSDGCRITNRVVVGGRTYEYPRYLFTNRSDDIRNLFLEACERLGVAARPSNRITVSVARRDAVERLDAYVGPKS